MEKRKNHRIPLNFYQKPTDDAAAAREDALREGLNNDPFVINSADIDSEIDDTRGGISEAFKKL